MDRQAFERVCKRLDGYGDRIVELQRELVRRPAIQPAGGGQGEAAKAAFLREYLERHGFGEIEEIRAPDPDAPDGHRPNLIVRVPGQSHDRTIWFMAHLDVVPAGDLENWDGDPFELRVDGDRLYGRGVEDNHQGLVASLMAVMALKEEGLQPRSDAALLLVADEETGSQHGVQHVLEHGNPLRPTDLVVVPDGGEPDGSFIEIAEKSILWIRLAVTGQTAHGSTPHKGRNATEAAAHLIVRLTGLREQFGVSDPMFDPPTSTFAPTKREPNVGNVNTIPGQDVSYFDCRILPQVPLQDVERAVAEHARAIEEQFGVTVEIGHAQREEAAPPTAPDAPVVQALSAAISAVYGVSPRAGGIGGGTVAAFLRRAGIPAAVWSRMDETMHGPNEYCLLSNLVGDAKVFAHMMLTGE